MELEKKLEQAELALKEAQNAKALVVAEILEFYANDLEKSLKAKDEPYGSVTADSFTVTYPKRVTWDQAKLEAIANDIKTNGENPLEYVDLEYSVSEDKYKAWPESIRAVFTTARTVARGNPSVKVKKNGN